MNLRTLQQQSKRAPETPGVYTWRDAGGHPLYIGKAVNLRSRLLQYRKPTDSRTRPDGPVGRVAAMVRQAALITWEKTDTDIEALILESQLIKREKPVFNIMLRDDKQYFYVGFTHDVFPNIFITHQPQGTGCIGPFTEGAPLKAVLRILRRLFPYCTCKQTHHLRCLNAHIGICPGYCCLKKPATAAQKKEYAMHLRAIRDVLTGKRDALVRRLARTMPDMAIKLLRVYQNAQVNARNQTRASRMHDEFARVEAYDIANIQGAHAVGAMVVFTNGQPDKTSYRLFNIKTLGGDTDMLSEMLERRIKHDWPTPDLIVIDGGKAQLNVARRVFGKYVRVVALTKDGKHRGVKIIEKEGGHFTERPLNALPHHERLLITRANAEAHRFAISHYRARHRKALK